MVTSDRFVECTVSTPQHKNGKVDYWHKQDGIIDTFTWEFKPNTYDGFNHKIDFETKGTFLKYKV